jgi:hypothetical protein
MLREGRGEEDRGDRLTVDVATLSFFENEHGLRGHEVRRVLGNY